MIITRVGRIYRYRGPVDVERTYWTIYEQKASGFFLSGSCKAIHHINNSVGRMYVTDLPGARKNPNTWERLE